LKFRVGVITAGEPNGRLVTSFEFSHLLGLLGPLHLSRACRSFATVRTS